MAVDPTFSTVQPRRIDEDHLPLVARQDAQDPISSRLRLVGGDGELEAHEAVQSVDLPAFGRPTMAQYPDTN